MIPKGYKQTIDKLTEGDWYLLAKRSNIPPMPISLKINFSSRAEIFKNIYSSGILWACFWHGDECEFYLHNSEFRKVYCAINKLLYSFKPFKIHHAKTVDLCAKAVKKAGIFYDPDWAKFKNAELLKAYDEIVKAYGTAFVYGFITWCSKVLQDHARAIVVKREKILLELDVDVNSALGALIHSDKETYYTKKKHALDLIAKISEENFRRLAQYRYT